MKILHCEQRSPEWIAARLGKLTGSRVGDAFAQPVKGKSEAVGRRNLRIQLALERLTGTCQDGEYTNAAMQRGVELEPAARRAYEARTGTLIETVGFIEHDELMAGCSPDGLIDTDGLVEFKCHLAPGHLDCLREGIPRAYYLQIWHGLWLTGRAWGDLVSFHPTFPEPLQLAITRIHANAADIAAHELNVRLFLDEVAREYDEIVELSAHVSFRVCEAMND